MLRLIMQHEELAPTPTATRANGNGSYIHSPSPAAPSANGLNLNFRVFEIDCPELEAALKASQVEGANVKKLVLLGMEIFDKPKPAIEPPKPIAAALLPATVLDPKEAAAKLKEELKAKQAERNAQKGWFGLFRKPATSDSKPLPLPG